MSVKGTRRPVAVLEFRFYQGSAASLAFSTARPLPLRWAFPMQEFDDELERDLKLIDRYKEFSSELLKIALVAIAVLGFFFDKLATATYFDSEARKLLLSYIANGALAFLASGGASLAHRFVALAAASFHVRAARRAKVGRPEDHVADMRRSRRLYIVASSALLLATVLAAAGAFILVFCMFEAVALYEPKT